MDDVDSDEEDIEDDTLARQLTLRRKKRRKRRRIRKRKISTMIKDGLKTFWSTVGLGAREHQYQALEMQDLDQPTSNFLQFSLLSTLY